MKPLQRPRTELFCSHSYLRSMLTSCQSQHRIYLKDDTRHRAMGKRWERRTFVTVITLTLALTCPLISVSATCWGSFNWLIHMNRCKESRIKSCYNCHNSALVEANRLRLPQMEAVMMFKFISASLWGCLGPVYSSFILLSHVTIITLTVALTCPLNSVSASCWGRYNWPLHLWI